MAACVVERPGLAVERYPDHRRACSTNIVASAAAEPYSCRTFDISIAATARCRCAAPRGRPARAKNATKAAQRHNGPAKASPARKTAHGRHYITLQVPYISVFCYDITLKFAVQLIRAHFAAILHLISVQPLPSAPSSRRQLSDASCSRRLMCGEGIGATRTLPTS